MPISEELLEILVCPETNQPVRPAPADVIARVNAEIGSGRLRNRGGDKVESKITEALLREDGHVLYVVDDGIPVMLIEESIEL
jgi:uncharacterized protein YbaR (Trm112 family)